MHIFITFLENTPNQSIIDFDEAARKLPDFDYCDFYTILGVRIAVYNYTTCNTELAEAIPFCGEHRRNVKPFQKPRPQYDRASKSA
jgi:hypothetical protein